MTSTTKLLALVVLLSRPVLADAPPADVRALFQHGLDAFAHGDARGARDDFEQALALSRRPAILFNLGLVCASLGDSAKAVALLDEVLEHPEGLAAERIGKARAVRAEHAAHLAEVLVVVPLEGADVRVNGETVGRTPLGRTVRVKAGEVVVGAVAPKHLPANSTLSLVPGSKTEVRLDLMPIDRQLAQLKVRSATPQVDLFVDGVLVGRAPFLATFAVEPGQRHVELRREGFRSQGINLALAEGGSGEWAADLEEDATVIDRRGGTLRAAAGEGAIDVTVDGRRRGLLSNLKLVPGVHEVRFERGGFFPEVREVDVRAWQETVVELHFSPTPELRAKLEGDRQFFRTLGFSGLGAGVALAAAGAGYLAYNLSAIATLQTRIEQLQNEQNGTGAPQGCRLQNTCAGDLDAAQTEQQRARGYTSIGVVGLAVGVVALGVGTWALLVAPDPSRYDRPKDARLIDELSFAPAPGGGVVHVAGHF